MSDEFQIGDVVVCVFGGPTINEGETHRIVGFRTSQAFSMLGVSGLGLFLKGKRSVGYKGSYDARRFRKLLPADEDFTLRIRACCPPLRLSAPSGER